MDDMQRLKKRNPDLYWNKIKELRNKIQIIAPNISHILKIKTGNKK
jgi:hypothetical protein